MKEINFADVKQQYIGIKNEIQAALDAVFRDAAFSGGKYVEAFEENFASFCESNHCVAVNSGTSALHLALLSLGISEGDEVIVPANTFIATPMAVSHANATPVFVDCSPGTWNIDFSKIEEKITPRTKAIIGVHLYGQPFDFDEIKKIALKHKLYLLEDGAQAHGARYKGKPAGSLGDLACFSFYPSKNLGAFGEGGAITTNDEKLAENLRLLRNLGQSEKYVHDIIGYNLRLHGIQGAVLNVKLKYLDEWNNRRREIASLFHKGITNKKVQCQLQPDWAESVYHLFVITVKDREQMVLHLKSKGINPGIHYPIPCHLQKAYRGLGYTKGDFPNSEYLADHCLSLPMYPELTDDEVKRIIHAVNDYNY